MEYKIKGWQPTESSEALHPPSGGSNVKKYEKPIVVKLIRANNEVNCRVGGGDGCDCWAGRSVSEY
jgi:hypothetical protein